MGFSRFFVGLLLLIVILSCIDARRSASIRGSSSRRGSGSSASRGSSRGTQKPAKQPQTSQASQTKRGQEYRDWAAKLTGAGNEQRPKIGGNTGQHGNKASRTKQGQEYRNWGTGLTGAGNEQRPRTGVNTGQHGIRASQTKQGQEYRNWATKLTGANSEQRPKIGGNTGQRVTKGSNPSQIGWNVPPKQPAGGVGTKPSAPDLATKTSATNVQSGYSPSGGYNRQPAQNPAYGQSPGNQYNPSSGGYNPPVGQGYNPSVGGHHPYGAPPPYSPSHGAAPPPYSAHGQSYNPSYQSHSPPAYNPYNPSYGHSYSSNPGAGYNPPVGHVPQTILVQQAGGGSGRPGIGQLAKEAFVYAGVSAGVNAAVNRILPGGIYGHSGGHGSSSSVPAVAGPVPVTHTEITYNNYYNNGTNPAADPNAPQANPGAAAAPVAAAPAAPVPVANPSETPATAANNNAVAPSDSPPNNANSMDPKDAVARNNPSPLGFIITDADLKKLSEDLLSKEKNNAFKHITMSLQGQKMDDSVTDDAPEPLLTVKDEAYEIPTIKAVVSLHDNYELDVKTKEEVTSEERKEENELLDRFMETEVLSSAMKFLADKGYVPNDEYEFKDALRRIWFSQFKRIDGDASSSGFETVFLAEQFEKEIIGLHNWIYFAKQEAAKKANYLGYIKQTSLGSNGAIVKLRSTLNDIVQPVTTIFVGTSPELEMALYTVCFFTRPNNPCPVSIGGTEFLIIANRVNYFGKDILVSAYPEI